MIQAPKFNKPERSWAEKFRAAFLGIYLGMRGQSSFRVHVASAVAVVAAAAALRVTLVEWCVLVLCITSVLASEMFNSALEWLAPAVDQQENGYLAGALDVASAAVLLTAIGSTVVGALIFGFRLGVLLGYWEPSVFHPIS